MEEYTKNYPGGWKAKPNTTTPATPTVMDHIEAGIFANSQNAIKLDNVTKFLLATATTNGDYKVNITNTLATNMIINVLFPTAADSTKDARLSIDNGGNYYNIKDYNGIQILASSILGKTAVLYYNGTNFIVLNAWGSIPTGWNPLDSTLTYSSADSPTFIVGTSIDLTGILSKGMKLQFQQAQALAAYWNLDSNSNSQVGSFNGTDTNISYVAGKFSNCASFNGTNSKIVIADSTNLKPNGAFTIGMWTKTNSTGVQKTLYQSFSANTNYAGILLYINAGNTVTFATHKNAGTTVADYSSFVGSTNVCDNTFHYIVCTFNNNYAQLYVDGKLEASGYAVTPAFAATNYVRIGCQNNSGSDNTFMNGLIDDLFLINGYALDEETIKAKYLTSTAQGIGNIIITKRFFVTDLTATTLTLYGGTDFQVTNSLISNPMFSITKEPYNFNLNPDKWAVKLSNLGNQYSTPSNNVWYNPGTLYVDVPVGSWFIDYKVLARINPSFASTGYRFLVINTTLATANNAETDTDMTDLYGQDYPYSGAMVVQLQFNKNKNIMLSTKTRFYILCRFIIDAGSTFVANQSGLTAPTVITARCSYL